MNIPYEAGRLSADWRRIPLRQCQECPKLVPAAQERCKSHEHQEPLEYVIHDSSGVVLDRWVESDDDDPCCDECLDWATGADLDERTKRDALQGAINAAHERLQWAQQGVFLRKRDECPPRSDGDKPHCPDCSGIVGETGIVW